MAHTAPVCRDIRRTSVLCQRWTSRTGSRHGALSAAYSAVLVALFWYVLGSIVSLSRLGSSSGFVPMSPSQSHRFGILHSCLCSSVSLRVDCAESSESNVQSERWPYGDCSAFHPSPLPSTGELGSGQNPGPVAMSTVSEPYGTRRGDVAIATAYEAFNAMRFGYASFLFAACREGGQVGVVIYGGWQAGWGERGGEWGSEQ